MSSLPKTVSAPLDAEVAFGYQPRPGVVDEMVDGNGMVRPHWRAFLHRLGAMPPAQRERGWQEARQLIHDNGVSYNIYGDPRGLERPWSLEPMPLLLSAGEWNPLAAAVAQRAQLLDRVLADLYGPQRALRERWLPPELIFSHPGFLRAVHGAGVPLDRWLPLHAVDLARGPDGAWYALADRTQSPAGAGYALENRLVTSRALPELFREGNVERLALFFRRVQETLVELAAPNLRGDGSPRVVLLTAGPYNATYFEQAYLAQYLGYTLSTGRDLTVRGERLYLKSLAGLQAVDVVLRRINDDYCDPLELRAESVLGVPGLVEAARQRQVVIANPLGTGVVQTAALLPYLPVLCRHLLGEELRLPSVATYWCGDPAALPQVLARFNHLVLKPALPDGVTQPVFLSRLSAEEREQWRRRVESEPRLWVAQEELAASTAPSLVGEEGAGGQSGAGPAGRQGELAPRTLVLRTYTVMSSAGPMVMPGALARVAGQADSPEVSMQAGSGSKDVWVLADQPVNAFSLLPPPSRPVTLTRGSGDLPSQTADNLFWLGRYAERAEGIARLARVLVRLLEEGPAEANTIGSTWAEPTELLRTLAAFADPGGAPPPIPLPAGRQAAIASVLEAIFDDRRTSSLVAVNQQVVTVARLVRDWLSADSWRVLTALADELSDQRGQGGDDGLNPAATSSAALMATLDRTVLVLAAFSGIAQESMTRGHAWRFLDIGRRLERAIGLVRLLRHTLVESSARPGALLETVLEVADSGITYRRRYLATLQGAPVLDLLLTDDSNPRALVFQLAALTQHWQVLGLPALGLTAQSIARSSQASGHEPDPAPLLADLQAIQVEALAQLDDRGRRPALEALLTRLGTALPALSQLLSGGYLNHATVSRHLGTKP